MAKLPSQCVCQKLRMQGPSLAQAEVLSISRNTLSCPYYTCNLPPFLHIIIRVNEEEEEEMEEGKEEERESNMNPDGKLCR